MNEAPVARRPPPPVPVSVLTGFLGAGKTTLLNRLLPDPALAGTLVLINEFGEIGLDHLFVEKIDGDMMMLSSGCLCCTMRGDLIDTLEDILRRRDNGRIKDFRRLVIETTGLADPAPVLHTIMSHPYLLMRFRLDGVITLVDAVNGEATLDAHREAVKQAAVADRLVITKTDLLTGAAGARTLAGLKARLAALNPGARVLDAARGEATATSLLDAGLYDPSTKSADVRRWLNAEAFAAVMERAGGHAGHDHDPNRHDAHIRAFCLRDEAAIAPHAFELFLDMLRKINGAALLRLKGVVKLADDPSRPLVVHAVQHVLHPPARLDAWPDADTATRLVFILNDLDPGHVRRLWAAFAGTPAPDTPDAAALTGNPLAPGRGGLLD